MAAWSVFRLNPKLTFPPLGSALELLREAVNVVARNPEDALWRDGLIQRFEYTFELARATMTRFLYENSNSLKSEDKPDYQEIIRTANQDGLLLGSWPDWRGYRDARNETSHTYNQTKAEMIAAQAPEFLKEAEFLYATMVERRRRKNAP
jgi:nucleotidyltransferase substrate binding protein (TIGR01987 family)